MLTYSPDPCSQNCSCSCSHMLSLSKPWLPSTTTATAAALSTAHAHLCSLPTLNKTGAAAALSTCACLLSLSMLWLSSPSLLLLLLSPLLPMLIHALDTTTQCPINTQCPFSPLLSQLSLLLSLLHNSAVAALFRQQLTSNAAAAVHGLLMTLLFHLHATNPAQTCFQFFSSN